MPFTIGTSGGNKDPLAIYLGTSGGNKKIYEATLGTSGGNKLVFNPSLTPSAVNWNDVTGNPNVDTNSQTISGMGAILTLSITRSSTANNNLSVFVNSTQVASTGPSGVATLEFEVFPGDSVFFRHSRTAPVGTSTGTITIRNVSNGNATLDTYTYSLTLS